MAESAAANADVIDVRPDERFDEQALANYLCDVLPNATGRLEVEQFGGGHANLTYLLRYPEAPGGGQEYVLRRPPLGPVPKGAHDMQREYRALSRLWEAFPLAPRAYHFCDDHTVIGADFVIMDRRGGVVIRGGQIPAVFGGGSDAEANRKISEVVIDTLADFHSVDPASVGLEKLGRPEGFLARQVGGWAQRHEAARIAEVPVASDVVRWLEEQMPESPAPTLVHNDWKLDNLSVAEDDPGRCVAVYDWDMCTLGDPLCDVGTLLCSWAGPEEGGGFSGAMPTHTPGFIQCDEAIERYCAKRGLEPERIAYYHVFGVFKMAVVIEQIFARYHRGQTQDERFAQLDQVARLLHERASALRG